MSVTQRRVLSLLTSVLVAAALISPAVQATAAPAPSIPSTLSWRNVGPLRSGRSIAVDGSTARPNEYYAGATGGGVWKTTDSGTTWRPVSDGFFTSSSVGAVAVCAANPDVVYAGTGEVDLRGDVIPGDGVYRTTDGGRTWAHVGLTDSQTVSKIRIDPKNCDHAYAAVLGHPFGHNTQRGVFSTGDGGKSWQRILYVDDQTGAADLAMDPANSQVLYASMWHAFRNDWHLESGGPGDGLFKSADGGKTWTNLSTKPGFPKAPLGKISVAPSAAKPGLVWAIVEAQGAAEGMYRSDDGGATWREVNNNANIHQRPFYFTHLAADPKDPNTVYALNVSFLKSTDGGKTFGRVRNPHSDNHDMWIDPTNPQRMIEANDGGANVSVNGGATWTASTYSTAQIYHVTTSPSPDGVPYLICGAQQDLSTACLPSDGDGSQFFDAGGGESGYIAIDQRDANIIYAGSYGDFLSHFDRRLGQSQLRDVSVWPDNPMGYPAGQIKERFQWTFPIMTTPSDPGAVYTSSQHVFRSTNGGQSWQRISPDLTRHDPATLGDSGGPINKDQTSIEYYADVFALAPSPLDRKVIWTGSDDGLVHVTRDAGKHWTDVTPHGIPHFIRFATIDASAHDTATAYAAAQRYRQDDRHVYLYKTHDGGRHWTKITNGIPDGSFAWSIRQDPVKAGLLYAATEHAVYVSLDDGAHWQPMKLNMPETSVQDLTVHGDDLIAATHGRGFYVLSGLSLLRQLVPGKSNTPPHGPAKPLTAPLVPPGINKPSTHPSPNPDLDGDEEDTTTAAAFTSHALPGGPRSTAALSPSGSVAGGSAVLFQPRNPTRSIDAAATVDYKINKTAKSVSLTFLDAHGRPIQNFTGLPGGAGFQEFQWDMRYPGAVEVPGGVFWAADPGTGPLAPLGAYSVRLTVDGTALSRHFTIKKDPRLTTVTAADINAEFQLGTRVVQQTTAADQAVNNIGLCTSQVDDRVGKAHDAQITKSGAALDAGLTTVAQAIHQDKSKAGEDPLKYPIRLNNKIDALLFVIESADNRPNDQTYAVFNLLTKELAGRLGTLKTLVGHDVVQFNGLLQQHGLAPVHCTG